MPTQLRLSDCAAARVVPEPAKQSSTRSPSFEDASIINFSKSKLFSVGYCGYWGSFYSQISCIFFPPLSSRKIFLRGIPLTDHSTNPPLSHSSKTAGSVRQWRPFGGFIPFQILLVLPFIVSPGAWSGIVV